MSHRFVRAARLTLKKMGDDDVSGLAAELAYRFFLTLFPFFIFLAALGGIVAHALPVDNPTDRIMNEVAGRLPADAASLLRRQLDGVIQARSGALLSFGVLGAIWAASGAVGTITKALNRACDIEETRPFWKRYLLNLGITALAGTGLIAVVLVMLAGQFFGDAAAERLGIGGSASVVISVARWPLLIAILLAVAAFLYWAAPNAKLPFRLISPGAVAFVAAWLVASTGFGVYVANFGSYNATYGALGAVVILLLWFYLSALVFLAGAELNAVIDTLAARNADEAAPQAIPLQAERGRASDGAARGREPISMTRSRDSKRDDRRGAGYGR